MIYNLLMLHVLRRDLIQLNVVFNLFVYRYYANFFSLYLYYIAAVTTYR